MDIVFVSPEVVPFSKVGGLADVVGALPKSLRALGHKVTVVSLLYGSIDGAEDGVARRLTKVKAPLAGEVVSLDIHEARLPSGVNVVLLAAPRVTDRQGVYGEHGEAYPDNHLRFGALCRGAVEWIERARDRPFFAWVHLIDAHAPYGNHRWPQDFGPSGSDRYDGEGFNEHGARYHYYDVHEESIRVVLLVRGPSVEPGTRHALTALLDLHATVLDLAGRPIDGPSPARSLVPVLFSRHGGTPADWRDEVYSDVAEFGGARPSAMTLIAPPWKILFDAARNGWELYNLSLDPREERNLFDEDPTRAAELRARQLDDRAGAGRGVTRPCARKPDWGTVRAHRRRSDRA